MTEPMGRAAAAVSLAFIVGVGVMLAFSPHFGAVAWTIGLVAAVVIGIGVLRQQRLMPGAGAHRRRFH